MPKKKTNMKLQEKMLNTRQKSMKDTQKYLKL